MKYLILFSLLTASAWATPTPSPTAPLTLPSPIAVPAKSFNKLWIRSIEISAPSPSGEASATIVLVPYSTATGEMDSAAAQVITIPDIFARIAAHDGEMKQLMGMILDYASKEAKRQGKL